MFAIEKNIPLATKQAYPFDQMQSGDSFLIPETDPKKIGYIRAQINNLKNKYPGKVITTRKEETGLRVWLIFKEQA
jgi:hypothetical protein